jgi:hypothetical protein
MSLLTQQTSVNNQLFYFVKANGQQLDISTLNANTVNANTISTASLVSQYISTVELLGDTGTLSTFSTSQIDLDGQLLTANKNELLLNGIPVATQSSLSSIADWSLDPAISTVQMAGYDLDAAGTVSSQNVRAGNGFFTNLIAFNSMFISTMTSTISTSVEFADEGNFSTLNADTISSGLVLANSVSSSQAQFGGLDTPNLIIEAGGQVLLRNGGASFSASTGSAVAGFAWDPAGSFNSDMFYDTTISSLHIMTKNGVGSYITDPASKLYIQEVNTSSLTVSSINGSEFTSTGITVQVAGVSSLVANSISSLGAEIRNALVSTIQFKPSFDVGLNFDTAALGNALQGGLTRLGIGAGAGLGIVGSGLLGAVFSRPSATSYNTNAYYQYAVPTQLQFSTLGADTSTFQRLVSSSGAGNEVPGVEIVVSSIISSGTLCVRSLGDPTNLADPSTFTSSIQAFGEWVPVPIEVPMSSLSTIEDWAIYPAISSITFSTGVAAVVEASPGSDIALSGTSIKLIGSYTDANNLLLVSSLSTATILGANDNLFGIGLPGLKIDAPNLFFSTTQTNITGLINCSSITANSISSFQESISSLYAFDTQGQNLTIANKTTSDLVWARQVSTAVILGANTNLHSTGAYGIEIQATNGEVYLNTSTTTASGSLVTGDVIVNNSIKNGVAGATLGFGIGSISSLTASTINNYPFAPVHSEYTSTIINNGLSTIAQPIASTSVVINFPSYTLSQANTSILNTTGQYHESFLYLTIDGETSPSTITTLPNKTNSFSGQSISFRGPALSSGTYNCVLWGYSDTDGALVVSQTDLFTLTNLQ